MNIIEVKNITKKFNGLTAVDHISFEVKKGEIFGLLGPNGAGKSTTINMLATLLALTEGNATINNFNVLTERDEVRKSIGLIHYPQVLFLDEPTLGLDPQTRAHLWEYILKLKRERNMTIFMTTHYMNEAEYCDRIAIIDYGKIAALDTPAHLKKRVGGDIIRMGSGQKAKLRKELEERYKKEIKEEDGILQLEIEDGEKFLPRLFNELDTKIDSLCFFFQARFSR